MFDWKEYQCELDLPGQASELRHGEVIDLLHQLKEIRSASFVLAVVGHSVEQRPIYSVTIGNGQQRLLAWSQMHGNEPTHTAVLLRLLDFFQRAPDHPISAAILAECQLTFVPMLNPDGVELYTRRNAQQIDINRDALQLQSPEGQVLRKLVLDIQPQFALNLHNQNPRTAVGNPPQPAAVSLLVPPIDQDETSTPSTATAEKLAACFRQAVEPHCLDMISRYNADFMPRCFGEWVQQQNVATLTVEAGGWTTPDTSPLVKLHFLGMLAVLENVATGDFNNLDPNEYRTLPRSSEQLLFDRIVQGVQVFRGDQQTPLITDLGINLTDPHRQRSELYRSGAIDDLGDLSVTAGKLTLSGEGLACLPGSIIFVSEVTPTSLPDSHAVSEYMANGVTSLIGCVDITANDEMTALERLRADYAGSLNLGFLAKFPSTQWSCELAERLERAITYGILGVLDLNVPPEALPLIRSHSLSVFKEETIQSSLNGCSIAQFTSTVALQAMRLNLSTRGRIDLGSAADLLFVKQANHPDSQSFDPRDLHQVWVGGNVAFADGKVVGESACILLMPS